MAWQMPNSGSWNQGMAMAGMPAMTPDMNMGTYTHEQWAVMQQQNWQQWAQWQQQYAQWQNQYGEKYAEQMQAYQQMGGMPPLPPTNAPPPAPPPPDKPPPPPHENNQPLFAQKTNQPAPVPAPNVTNTANQERNIKSTNVNLNPQQKGNWSYSQDTQSSVNAEALKKLSEEERLFDIQFQKWEEEIEKWKRDNVNHPDKQAYKEYEDKFEACRAQLLERRQQMKQKRASLIGNAPATTPQSTNTALVNIPLTAPPPLNTQNNFNQTPQTQNKQSQNSSGRNNPQNYGNNPQNFGNNPQNYGNNPQSYGNNPQNYGNNSQNYGNNTQSYGNNPQSYGNNTQNYGTNPNQYQQQKPRNQYQQQYQEPYQQYNMPQNSQSRSNNKTIEIQEDIHQHASDTNVSHNSYSASRSPSFLPSGRSAKSIPGLDLVPEHEKPKPPLDVIDITDDKNPHSESQPQKHVPDYTKISKGINNILGDEKIMNILSMVRQTSQDPKLSNPSGDYGDNGQSNTAYGEDNRNQNYNNQQQHGNRQNMQYNQQGQTYPVQQNQNQNQGNRPGNMPQGQYNNNFDKNIQYRGNNMGPYNNGTQNPPPLMQQTPRPLMQEMPQKQNMLNDFRRGPNNRGPNDFQRGPNDLQRGPNEFQRGPNDFQRGPNDFQRGPNERKPLLEANINTMPSEPIKPKWVDEPMFTPSVIVEYEHKPLRLKAREFIEPVHMFDYNHKSKDGEERKDYSREVNEIFTRKPRRLESDYGPDRYYRDQSSHYERRAPRDHFDSRVPPRDDFDDRRRPERLDDRRNEHDRYGRSDDMYRERDRDGYRERDYDRGRDFRMDDRDRGRDLRYDDRDRGRDNRIEDRDRGRDNRLEDRDRGRDNRIEDRNRDYRKNDARRDRRSVSHDRDSRKRGLSRDSEISDTHSKKSRDDPQADTQKAGQPKHIIMIDDILELPGRSMRPEKIVIILRGPPGSGKSYLAKLIRDREAQFGETVRIMSIDDYFMQEGEIEEKDPATGKMIKKPTLKYEYEESAEESYINSLKRAFKRSLTDGYFTFLIYDAVNETLRSYADIWNLARQNGFQVYVCTMELDTQVCFKRNIHNRTLEQIELIVSRFFPTPPHHIQLDPTTLLQNAAIPEVQMEDADDEVIMEDAQEIEVESIFTSKWEKLDDATQLARLDGTSKPLRPSQLSMEDYLQLDDWKPNTAKPGKKTVRWADIEERRQQEKMRAIGFVVGQTDWNRMTDPTMGSSALTQTKYIERVRRN